jgi:hypothetical protein
VRHSKAAYYTSSLTLAGTCARISSSTCSVSADLSPRVAVLQSK